MYCRSVSLEEVHDLAGRVGQLQEELKQHTGRLSQENVKIQASLDQLKIPQRVQTVTCNSTTLDQLHNHEATLQKTIDRIADRIADPFLRKLFCQLGRTLSRCRCLSCRKAAQSMMDNQCLLPTILHQVKVSLRQSIVVCIPNRFRMIPRLAPPKTRLDQAKVFAMTLPSLLGLTGVIGVGNI